MKVLLVSSKYPPEYAGSGLRAKNTYLRITKKYSDINFSVLCNSTEFAGNKNYKDEEIEVKRISSTMFHKWNNVKSPLLKKLFFAVKNWVEGINSFFWLSKQQFDLIHVFGISASTASAIIWARTKKKPLIVELVNAGATPNQNLPIIDKIYKPNLNKKTAIVAISKQLGEDCKKYGLTKNVWVRPNPVDETRFFPDFETKQELRKNNLPSEMVDKKIISTVAKFMPRKNQIFLIDVLNELDENYVLVLAGPIVKKGSLLDRDNAYLDEIKQKIKEKDLENRVFIKTGFVEAEKYMKLSDVYLMPHYGEGLGTPMLEAVSCGVPVVANKNEPAFIEWIKDGENGFVCDMEAKKWAVSIKKALDLSNQHMEKEAKKIHSVASTKIIDDNYYAILKTLVDWQYEEPVDISNIMNKA